MQKLSEKIFNYKLKSGSFNWNDMQSIGKYTLKDLLSKYEKELDFFAECKLNAVT